MRRYSTHLFTGKAQALIEAYKPGDDPLFICA